MDTLATKNKTQARVVVEIIKGRSVSDVARDEGISATAVAYNLKTAIKRIECNDDKQALQKSKTPPPVKKKPGRKDRYNLADILSNEEYRALEAFVNGQSLKDISIDNSTTTGNVIKTLQSASDQIGSFIETLEEAPSPNPVKKSRPPKRKRKPYHKDLRQIFTAANITGSPLKSADAQEMMETRLTGRQKEIVTLVLKNKSLSEIARVLDIHTASVSVTFKTAVKRLESTQQKTEHSKPKSLSKTGANGTALSGSKKHTKLHYDLRDVLIKQGVQGNPLKSDKFKELADSRLTSIQKDTVKKVIVGRSLLEIAKEYNVGKAAIHSRLRQAIERLAHKKFVDHKQCSMHRVRPSP